MTAISRVKQETDQIIARWRVYIGQANTSSEWFFRVERLTRAYRESDKTLALFAQDKFFTKTWLKYVRKYYNILKFCCILGLKS